MPVVPPLPAVTTGVYVSSQISALVAAASFGLNSPHAELRQTAAQTFTTGVAAALQFNAEDIDTDPSGVGGHDNVTNNSRYTAQYPGWYLVSASIEFNVNGTGGRFLWFAVNGTDVNGSAVGTPANAATATGISQTKLIFLNTNDYVEAMGLQFSGGNLATVAAARDQSHMSVLWVSN
jgi:hypothetical protein